MRWNLTKPVLVAGFFCLEFSRIPAQIELQDLSDPVPEKKAGLNELPDIDKDSEAEMKNLINQINRSSHVSMHSEEAGSDPPQLEYLKRQQITYQEAPDHVIVELEFLNGERIWGEVSSRSFRVEASSAVFPVLLHQLTEISRVDGEASSFVFHFVSGDQLQGKPRIDHIALQLPQGGTQIIPLDAARRIQVSREKP
jgi:hypothetical protein